MCVVELLKMFAPSVTHKLQTQRDNVTDLQQHDESAAEIKRSDTRRGRRTEKEDNKPIILESYARIQFRSIRLCCVCGSEIFSSPLLIRTDSPCRTKI